MVVITFLVMIGFILVYAVSVDADVPFCETDKIKELSKRRREALLEAVIFSELSDDVVDTTWSDMYYKSVLKV